MKLQLGRLIPVGSLLLMCLASCNKNSDQQSPSSVPLQASTQSSLTSTTNIIADATGQESAEVSDGTEDYTVVSNDSSACRTVTFSPSRIVYPHLKTIDFGTGCTGMDGITRSGKKFVTVYDNWRKATPGELISETTFSDFWVDSMSVSGNVKIYMDSAAVEGILQLKIVTNKTLTDTKGNTTTFIQVMYWKQIAGGATLARRDNVFQITGHASGSAVLDGGTVLTWTSKTDPANPIIKMGDCAYRSKGAIESKLKLAEGTVFKEYLDYGNGDCDNTATLTINDGTPQTITLPLFFWPVSL